MALEALDTSERPVGYRPSQHKERVFRDPVHGNIRVQDPVLLAMIDTPEFQRLRRIRQLGMCFYTYYGAEHSRFQHSIGAMWLMLRILNTWRERDYLRLTPERQSAAALAALLHDLGHGPFSHALEHVFSHYRHEELGRDILVRRLAPLMEKHGIDVAQVLSIIEGTTQDYFLHELISSQMDVDRMDYLPRDSLYAGVKYGLFDQERVISTLVPLWDEKQGRYVTAVDVKGLHAAEEYIFCRYFMYWQVYFHKTTRASEVLLRMILKRARERSERDFNSLYVPPNLKFMFSPSEASLDAFIDIDDYDVFHTIKLWRHDDDPVLADLSTRLIERRLFKMVPCAQDDERIEKVRDLMQSRYGDQAQYHWHLDRPKDSAYDFYRTGDGRGVIKVRTAPGEWREISEVAMTGAIKALAQEVSKTYIVVHGESYADVSRLLGSIRPPNDAGEPWQ